MSYDIQEGVKDTAQRLDVERAILARYPDARREKLPGGESVWSHPEIRATGVHLSGRLGIGGVESHLCPFEVVEGEGGVTGRVYGGSAVLLVVLAELKRTNLEAYAALVALAQEHVLP